MEAIPAIRFPQLSCSSIRVFPQKSFRSQVHFPRKLFFFCSNSGESEIYRTSGVRTVSPSLLASEKEEAKAILTLFLKKQGLSNAVAVRTTNKSDLFINHLVFQLHSLHRSRYLVGRELTTLEIRESLIPYLETLHEEHGEILLDVVEKFPDPPSEKHSPSLVSSAANIKSKQEKAMTRATNIDLSPSVVYLIELGLELKQIQGITRRFPSFAYYSLEGKIRPVVEFLLDLGVPKSDIPTILKKRPQLCGISLSENIIPTMSFLESLGVDKRKWAKVIHRFPAFLTYSRQKVNTTVKFLLEMGLLEADIGKVLMRCPNIISYSVEDKLRPTSAYFQSLGVNVAALLCRSPTTFGLSIDGHLKPVTGFFLERGYSMVEISTMVLRFGSLYTFSLTENLIPKWDFFLTMNYSKSELIKFPQYFGYSLEERIKPRYVLMKECGVNLLLNQLLSLSAHKFNKLLQTKMKKCLAAS